MNIIATHTLISSDKINFFFTEKKITSTSLLEYIANKKVERREERKKKIDERKRQRDYERNRKKNQVAKAIPSSIREQVTSIRWKTQIAERRKIPKLFFAGRRCEAKQIRVQS